MTLGAVYVCVYIGVFYKFPPIQKEGMSIGLTYPLFLSVVACGHLITLLVSQQELLLLLELPQLLVQAVLLERLCHLR